jgi:hypothetical protein
LTKHRWLRSFETRPLQDLFPARPKHPELMDVRVSAAIVLRVDFNSNWDCTLVQLARTPPATGGCSMNATATISLADTQRIRALEHANEVRVARAKLKRSVAFGELDAAEVILHCSWEAHSMTVGELLMSQRRWGANRCRKILVLLSMSERKTIGSMTDRQRRQLAALLTPRRCLGSAGAPRESPGAGEQLGDRFVDVVGEHVHVRQCLRVGVDTEAGLVVDCGHADRNRVVVGQRHDRVGGA